MSLNPWSGLLGPRYRVLECLANHPGRKTFLAEDLQRQQQVVIKLLLMASTHASGISADRSNCDWQMFKLLQREATILQCLDHPAIPRYLDFFECQNDCYSGFALVQGYIDAPSLQALVTQGRRFSEEEIRELALQLLKLLQKLHRRSPPLIHRDLKPSNILLGDPEKHAKASLPHDSIGPVYLVDFGSVQTLVARAGQTQTVVGTYGYMPPEQFGSKTIPASDLYALGATLIFLGTGKHPADLSQDGLQLQFESSVPHWSPALIQWVQQLTLPSLEQRFQTAKAAKRALQLSARAEPRHLTLQSTSVLPDLPPRAMVQLQPIEHGIRLVMLRDRLSLGLAQEPIGNPLVRCFRWVNDIPDEGLASCTACLLFASGMTAVMTLFAMLIDMIQLTELGFIAGLAAAFLGGVMGYAAWKARKILKRYRRRHQTATIEIGVETIAVSHHQTVLQCVPRHQAWQLVASDRSLELRLCIGHHTLRYEATSLEERDWLGQVLSDVLELPLEN